MKSEEPFTLHKLILYSKPECHLCDQARMVVTAVDPQFVLEEIDISGNARLTSTYGERIPVLRRNDTSAELDWPFDVVHVKRFLS